MTKGESGSPLLLQNLVLKADDSAPDQNLAQGLGGDEGNGGVVECWSIGVLGMGGSVTANCCSTENEIASQDNER